MKSEKFATRTELKFQYPEFEHLTMTCIMTISLPSEGVRKHKPVQKIGGTETKTFQCYVSKPKCLNSPQGPNYGLGYWKSQWILDFKF